MTAELIEPSSIAEMSQDDLESLITNIRERRDRVIKSRGVAHHRARNSSVLSLRPKLERIALRLDRTILKLNSDLAKAEKLVREMVALRLELGDATPTQLADELRSERDNDDGDPAAQSACGTPQGVTDESL